MTGKLTPARLAVLRRCAAPDGLRPLGTDWSAIYWLAESGYVEADLTAPRRARNSMDLPLYRATDDGKDHERGGQR